MFYFCIALAVVIVFHEFGHLLFAKLFGVSVHVFSVGFGPVLMRKRFGETEYRLCAVPFGGYVLMDGEYANDTSPTSSGSLLSKSRVQQMLVAFAGPLFSILLGFAIFTGYLTMNGVPVGEDEFAVIGAVLEGSPGGKADIEVGDRIIAVSGTKVGSWDSVRSEIKRAYAETGKLVLTLDRNGRQIVCPIPMDPASRTIGILPKMKVIKGDLIRSVVHSTNYCIVITRTTFEGIGNIITGSSSYRIMSGPVGIAVASAEAAKRSMGDFIILVGQISVSLGLLNMVPLPMLDGGVILFLLIEAMLGRPIRARTRQIANTTTFVLLIALAAMVTRSDIMKLFGR